jgi:plasmid maintenance system antidote protein VapI
MEHSRAAYDLAVSQVMDELHDESGKTRAELAQTLEMPDLEVTRIEHGAEPLTAGGLLVLMKFYGLSWQDFEARVSAALPKAQETIMKAGHRTP